jgi:hypothetical protein
MDDEMVTVYVAQGEIEESQVRMFLDAHGIPSTVRGEALRKTHAFVLDGLGAVQVQVAAELAERARELLEAVARGELSLDPDVLPENGEPS